MVAKISIGGSLRATVLYNARKVSGGEAKVLLSNRLFEASRGCYDPMQTIREFEEHMPSHFRTEKPVIHISLNPHPDDILSEVELAAIAEEYMERLGYGGHTYIVYKHEDIERHHLHIISLRVDGRGRKIDDRFEQRRSRRIVAELERKYALVTTGGGEAQSPYKPQRVDVERGDVERQVGSVVRHISSRYHYLTFKEYRALLSLYNVAAQEVRGEERGVPYCGVVYSATDSEGRRVGNPFNSSEFGKEVGYEALRRHFARSKGEMKRRRLAEQTRESVAEVLRSAKSTEHFREELSRRGIDVIFRENEAGRIYGVTYVDHSNRCVLNGSRMGREFAANGITERFSVEQVRQSDAHNEAQREGCGEEFSLGGLFDMPYERGDDEFEEEQVANAIKRRMKRRKMK